MMTVCLSSFLIFGDILNMLTLTHIERPPPPHHRLIKRLRIMIKLTVFQTGHDLACLYVHSSDVQSPLLRVKSEIGNTLRVFTCFPDALVFPIFRLLCLITERVPYFRRDRHYLPYSSLSDYYILSPYLVYKQLLDIQRPP